MVLGATLGYEAWWIGFHLGDIKMEEDDDDDEGDEAINEGSLKDDPYQVKNPTHDILV